ncbi:hypothetical protein HY468_04760 [Candidatus Roizmanbacteria bacterium]|nr:hypothetical protein [Candidatus Roizmanbacteria bacterium]
MSTTKQRGFTIMELLVGGAVFVVITILVNNILLNLLRGTVKQDVIRNVKQNGDFAMEVMMNKIRSARRLDPAVNCIANLNQLTITNNDGSTSRFYYDAATTQKIVDEITNVLGVTARYLTTDVTTIDSTQPAERLTFDCVALPGGETKITVHFTLRQRNANPATARSEEEALVRFENMAAIRNY